MSKKLKNIKNSLILLINGWFRGLKSADSIISTKATYTSSSTEIAQQQEIDNVFNDLLRGEETQRVKEMRDEYYRVLDESSKIKVTLQGVGNLAEDFDNPNITITATSRKKTPLDFVCKIEVYNPENLHLKCIQDNMLIQTQNNFFAENFAEDDYVGIFKIKRGEFLPRFKIEDYANKLVVRVVNDNISYLDFYVSKYASQFGFVLDRSGKMKKDNSALLISELIKLSEKKIRTSDVVDIEELTFDTEKAYGVPNPSHFEFDKIEYREVGVFDGNFVVSFKAHNKANQSAIEKYHTDELDKKLETHAVRDGKVVDIDTIMRHEKQEELIRNKNTDE